MLLTIIATLLILSLLIIVHELGHFLAAKRAGIGVEEFGLGYPPRIVGKKIKGTVYSLNWIPFGGFVRLMGEELEEIERVKDKERSFWAKSKKARTVVIVAGVLANFVLAIVCFSIVYSFAGIPTKVDQVRIVGLVEGAPGVEAGLQEEDIVLELNEIEISSVEQFMEMIEEEKGEEVALKVKRDGEEMVFYLVPRLEPPEGEGALGIVITDMEMKKYPFWQMPFYGTIEGLKEAFIWIRLVIDAVGMLIGNLITKGQVPQGIAGPVGILQITSTVARSGLLTILQFIGVLSINLAVLNILPFPALDGGRLIFIGYEVVTRKKPNPKVEHWVNLIGIIVLMFLLVLVTINDFQRLIETTSIGMRLKSILPF